MQVRNVVYCQQIKKCRNITTKFFDHRICILHVLILVFNVLIIKHKVYAQIDICIERGFNVIIINTF